MHLIMGIIKVKAGTIKASFLSVPKEPKPDNLKKLLWLYVNSSTDGHHSNSYIHFLPVRIYEKEKTFILITSVSQTDFYVSEKIVHFDKGKGACIIWIDTYQPGQSTYLWQK